MRFIKNAKLSNFRCYKHTEELELEDLNIFAGKNNAGKSALIQAILRLCTVNVNRHPRIATPGGAAHWGPDTYLKIFSDDWRNEEDRSEIFLNVTKDAIDRAISNLSLHYPKEIEASAEGTQKFYKTIFGYVLWPFMLRAVFNRSGGTKIESVKQEGVLNVPNSQGNWEPGNGVSKDSLKPDALAGSIVDLLDNLPIIHIPENRELTVPLIMQPISQSEKFSYETITADLLPLTLLEYHFEDPDKLRMFKDLLAMIMGEEVSISFKPSAKTMLLSIGKTCPRPIENLGAGVVQLMLFCLAVTKYDGGLLLYEEPEIHLHPSMQRRLIKSIQNFTQLSKWQAIITTHSNHILDFETKDNISTFIVLRADDETNIKQLARASLIEAIETLGVRPSSLLESNAIIWVEGPSDAIYIKFWIAHEARRLNIDIEEFADYAFSFFGGANLKHAGFTFAPAPQLINLLAIHPNSFVIIDSDRTESEQAPDKEYTQEFIKRSHNASRIWITQGREIENYLHDSVLKWAVNNLKNPIALGGIDRDYSIFSDQVASVRDREGLSRAAHDASENNKVGFARSSVDQFMSKDAATDWLERLDLRVRVRRLIKFILMARGPNTKLPPEILSE